MKRLRWGLVASLLAGVVVVSGCQKPYKFITRAEFDRLHSLRSLNAQQGDLVSSLTHDKELLTNENAELKKQLVDKTSIVELMSRELEAMKTQANEVNKVEGGEGVTVIQNKEGVGYRIEGDVLFDAGQATLKAKGEETLKKLVATLQDKENMIRISGYTDSDPIKHSGWKSNFELSGARALAVLEYLKAQGVEPARLYFAGYGEYSLIADGGKESKQKSRRAEILMLYEKAETPARTMMPKTAPPK